MAVCRKKLFLNEILYELTIIIISDDNRKNRTQAEIYWYIIVSTRQNPKDSRTDSFLRSKSFMAENDASSPEKRPLRFVKSQIIFRFLSRSKFLSHILPSLKMTALSYSCTIFTPAKRARGKTQIEIKVERPTIIAETTPPAVPPALISLSMGSFETSTLKLLIELNFHGFK